MSLLENNHAWERSGIKQHISGTPNAEPWRGAADGAIQHVSLRWSNATIRVPSGKRKSDPEPENILNTSILWDGLCFWTPTCETRHGPFRARPIDNGDAYATRG